ncbi:MAG: hypothetical protein VKJ06_06160, partial [Vampirovibrionales bacterium]|nr:hypothetical protein [Vampirovibrionales bacterium]
YRQWLTSQWCTARSTLVCISTNSPDLLTQLPEFGAQLDALRQQQRQIYVLTPGKTFYGGLKAIGVLLTQCKPLALRACGTLLNLPGVATMGQPFYQLFSNHRQRISGWLGLKPLDCETNVCAPVAQATREQQHREQT